MAALAVLAPAPAATSAPLEIKVLSNRADLISGGDALVEIALPPGVLSANVRVDVDGRDVTSAFAVRPNGRFMGLVEGLAVGDNVVSARAKGAAAAKITITNHPNGGPVFAGPQVQPWICNTVANGFGPPQDAQCNVPPKYEFFYRSASPLSTGFMPYNPASPPADVATTTTDQGVVAPYIVRRETGVMDRGWYTAAVLFNPSEPWAPWAPQRGWNGKIVWPFGGSSTADHYQRSPTDVLNDAHLSRGFMVATNSLNTHGQNNNDVVSHEAVMMLKERIIERYGEVRYVIGEGCSGGSLLQHMLANAYPGLIDGIQPACSYADSRTTANDVRDCVLLLRYFTDTSPALWQVEAQRSAVTGHESLSVCVAWQTLFGKNANPDNGCGGSSSEPWVYNAETNPGGERCTQADYQVAVWGRRDPEQWTPNEREIQRGFARETFGNEGIQYGLMALQSGLILSEQFVDLNEKVGGRDIDNNWIPQRSSGDLIAQPIAYRTGRVNDGRWLDRVPIIDLRGHDNEEIHTDYNSYAMRQRLVRANGHANNQVIFTANTPLVVPPSVSAEAFTLIDQWLAGIEADTSVDPLETKVVRHKPAGAVDSCYVGVEKITDQAKCRALFPYFGNVRIAAGGPLSSHYLKCPLKPLTRTDYPVTFTDEQWARLKAAFPTGVCDWNAPPVGEEPSIPWMTFKDGPGGRPLGAPPASTSASTKK
ncbi:MAG: hypothetical protein DMD91_26995 [Candidatus Rokuibacteriota bacterium]|nr:MAG: hypothetical protein DMD91_26995 [Candidatus Rokubacteria bacterium]